MKKLILLLLFCLPVMSYAELSSAQLSEFGGLVDILEPDLLADKYSPDRLNVLTDEFGCITKRRGYTPYLSTPLTELQSFRELYNYGQQGGGSFLIFESSASVYHSAGDGSATSIINGRNMSYRHTFMTAQDYLYGSNGYDNLWMSSCPATNTYTEFTVANSTNIVKARYICWWNNHAWYAGIDGQRSTIWWSQYLIPAHIKSTNFKNINVQDGDVITGIYKTSDNKLKIFKTYSTWEMWQTGVDADGDPAFDFRNLSQNIGCLYQTTIDELNNYPIWVSDRGVILYDGNFNIISLPIDNYIKSLNQLKITQGTLSYNAAADWGQGSGVNIDTTTTNGSVGMADIEISSTTSGAESMVQNHNFRQKFKVDNNVIMNGIDVKIYISAGSPDGSWIIYISSSSNKYENIIVSSTVPLSTFSSIATNWKNISIPNTSLYSGIDYYLYIVTGTANTTGSMNLYTCSSDDMSYRGTSYYREDEFPMGSGSWYDYTFVRDLPFKIYRDTSSLISSYTTGVATATNWSSWGTFTVDGTIPANSDTDYYVQTSTANDNFSTRPYSPITNGVVVPSSVGGYIRVTSSFTRTSASANPLLNKYLINYYSSGANPPVAKVFDGRYWLFVSTDVTNPINNVALVYQKTGDWTVFNNIYAGGVCTFRNNLYTGSSQNTGKIYRQDVPDVYADDGGAYNAYWCSKVFDFGVFANLKKFDSFWVSAKNSGNWNLNVSYRLDGTDTTWTDKSILLTNGYGNIVRKTPFAINEPNEGRYIQYKIWNNNANEHFRLKKIQTIFTIQPPQ